MRATRPKAVQLCLLAALALPSPRARADDGPTLPTGVVALTTTLQVGLSKDQAGAPLSLAPDIWVGVTSRLQLGLVTSIQGVTGFWSGALNGVTGTGLCVSGEADAGEVAGCNEILELGGVGFSFALRQSGPLQVVFDGGYQVASVDPVVHRRKIGVRARWVRERFSVGAAPSIQLTWGDRADDARTPELGAIFVPVELGVRVSPTLTVGLQSGVHGFWNDFDERYAIPVALAGLLVVGPRAVVTASFSLDRVAGFDGPGAVDLRSVSAMFGYFM